MNINTNDLTYAGSFAVDSGQAIVGDPCYLDGWELWNSETPFDYKDKKGQYGYLGVCATTLEDSFGELGGASAVAFSTGYGDGLYPVFVQMNSDGRISKVVIDFEGDIDLDE